MTVSKPEPAVLSEPMKPLPARTEEESHFCEYCDSSRCALDRDLEEFEAAFENAINLGAIGTTRSDLRSALTRAGWVFLPIQGPRRFAGLSPQVFLQLFAQYMDRRKPPTSN